MWSGFGTMLHVQPVLVMSCAFKHCHIWEAITRTWSLGGTVTMAIVSASFSNVNLHTS
eukprot:m.40536 g.40536  ORF g.40536 m.40536 type:complete len:58 (-) comp14824_c0_seq1:236-409(-)